MIVFSCLFSFIFDYDMLLIYILLIFLKKVFENELSEMMNSCVFIEISLPAFFVALLTQCYAHSIKLVTVQFD